MFRRTRAAVVAATLAAGLLPAAPAAAATSNDTHIDDLWGLDQINVDAAWSRSTGQGVRVAVIDSGVDLDHPDLAANVVRGATFLEGCETSCGDGDWQSGPDNPNGEAHGTHVAGTIAAVRDNGVGVAGVAPDATIVPVRVLDDNGSATDTEIVRGIDWAVANGVDVINMSLGKLPGIELLEETIFVSEVAAAVERATDAGVVVVIAAGNDSYPLCASPAAFDTAICVTATDYFGNPSYYSNGAIKADQMAVAAPGGGGHFCDLGILSTMPPELGDDGCLGHEGGYGFLNGTSMATPHVAGAAAQLVAMGCTRTDVHEILRTTSFTPLVGTGVWDPQYGYGIIDTAAATAAAATVCGSGGGSGPTNTAPTASDDVATVEAGNVVNISVLSNDTDPEGDALTITDVSSPSQGTAVIKGSRIEYTAPEGTVGDVTFTYTISDGEFSDTATVTVTVTEPTPKGGKGNGGGKGAKA